MTLQMQKKAVYNLIQLHLEKLEEEQEKKLAPWQLENYRARSGESLFEELHSLGIEWELPDFEVYAKEYDTPEEVAESLAREGEDPLLQDRIYLLVFELWRRLFPEKQSLSVFCDELDHQIQLYDQNAPNTIEDTLAYLQEILDDSVDHGLSPFDAFVEVQTYCANELENFIFDYILEAIEEKNAAYASELIEGFSPYMPDPEWFEYLEARVEILHDPEEGYDRLEMVIEKKPDLSLDLEILSFLATSGNHSLFYATALNTLERLTEEADLKEFVLLCSEHYKYIDLPKLAEELETIINERTKSGDLLADNDPDLPKIEKILKQRLAFAVE